MKPTEEQQRAADKVVECALLMQKCIRDAQRLGLAVSVSVFHNGGRGVAEVNARVRLVDQIEVAKTPEGKR
jgi:hypothetical protein